MVYFCGFIVAYAPNCGTGMPPAQNDLRGKERQRYPGGAWPTWARQIEATPYTTTMFFFRLYLIAKQTGPGKLGSRRQAIPPAPLNGRDRWPFAFAPPTTFTAAIAQT